MSKANELHRLQAILYDALSSPIGLLLRCSEPHKGRQRLYEARRAAADPALARLQFRLSPALPQHIAITKGPKE